MLAPVSLRSCERLPCGQRLERSHSSIAIDRSKGSFNAPTFGFFSPQVKVQKHHNRWNLHLHPLTNLGWFVQTKSSLKGLVDEMLARGVQNSYLFLLNPTPSPFGWPTLERNEIQPVVESLFCGILKAPRAFLKFQMEFIRLGWTIKPFISQTFIFNPPKSHPLKILFGLPEQFRKP